MSTFWDRINIDETRGAIFDGDRRYLMMRPDVLMGMLKELPHDTRSAVLSAFARSTCKHGGQSLAAYRESEGTTRLVQTVVDGAAAFGWGTWRVATDDAGMVLDVENSPFAAGHGMSDTPVCAPIVGILQSLAQAVMDGAVDVIEISCAAQHGGDCRFAATRAQ